MKAKFYFLISCAAFVVTSLVLTEQSAIAQRVRKPSPGGMLAIALRPSVQNEIGLQNDTQTLSKLEALRDVILKEQQELIASAKGDQDQYREESFRNIELKHRDELKVLFTEEQYKRVQQITWRVFHYRALTDPDVVDALKLTSKQVTETSDAQRDNIRQQKEYAAKTQNLNPQPARDELLRGLDEINNIYHKRIEEILSKEQLATFVEMQGKPLK